MTHALDTSRSQGYGHWALEIDDLDQAFAELLAAGAQSVSAPAPAVQPGARFAYVKDPEGNLLELIQPHPAAGATVRPEHHPAADSDLTIEGAGTASTRWSM
jgi:hypothetical protein